MMPTPSSPHAQLLQDRARQLVEALLSAGISAEVVPQSLRTYSIKIAPEAAGRLNLYYSPKKRRYRLGGHELNDPELWARITPLWDGDLGQAPAGGGAKPDAKSASKIKSSPKAKSVSFKNPAGQVEPAAGAFAAYVDGSHKKGRIGYGALILSNGDVVWESCGGVPVEMGGMRQVGGELTAVMEAIRWCRTNRVAAVTVHYDYAGIAAWPTGRWRAKLPATQAYRDFIRNCGVAIEWHKVKAHSGDFWNERADQLAKQGTTAAAATKGPPVQTKLPVEDPLAPSEGVSADIPEESADFADSPRFRFGDLHPDLYLGTASDRYGGWLGQIYPREKYTADITMRSKTVAGRAYQERVLPVKSITDYFAHFRILEIDFTFYQSLVDGNRQPTRAQKVLASYLRHLAPDDRLLLKVPQTVTVPDLFRGKSAVANEAYLNVRQFTDCFYEPAVELCGDHLWGFVFEQGYVPKARRQDPRELAANWAEFFSKAPRDQRYHLELRTTTYLSPPLFEVLARYGVGQVLSHWTWLPDLKTQFTKGNEQFYNAAQQAVVRLITPRGMRYADSYHKAQPFNRLIPDMLDDTMLTDTAAMVREALNQAYTMALIINNRAGGNAPLVAEALAQRLRAVVGNEVSSPVGN